MVEGTALHCQSRRPTRVVSSAVPASDCMHTHKRQQSPVKGEFRKQKDDKMALYSIQTYESMNRFFKCVQRKVRIINSAIFKIKKKKSF